MKKISLLVAIFVLASTIIAPTAIGQSLFNQRSATLDAEYRIEGGAAVASGVTMPYVGLATSWQVVPHFRLGGFVGVTTATATLPQLDVEATLRLGGNSGLHVDLSLFGGVGAISRTVEGMNDWFIYETSRAYLQPELGLKVGVGYNFNRLSLGAFVSYRHMLGTLRAVEDEDLTITGEKTLANPITFGASLGYRISADGVHRCGDHSWRIGAAAGLGNHCSKATVELIKFDRHAMHWVHLFGAEFSTTLEKAGRVSGVVKFGEQYLPVGASSVLIPELSVKLGMGEVKTEVSTHIDGVQGAELWRNNVTTRPALQAGVEARLNVRLAGFTLFGAIELTHDIPFHGDIKGGDINSATYQVINPTNLYGKVGAMITL